jgi:hypothetical protein
MQSTQSTQKRSNLGSEPKDVFNEFKKYLTPETVKALSKRVYKIRSFDSSGKIEHQVRYFGYQADNLEESLENLSKIVERIGADRILGAHAPALQCSLPGGSVLVVSYIALSPHDAVLFEDLQFPGK